jgi:hypothetical protein
MKKLLVFIGIIALLGCEKFGDTCWMCTYQKRHSYEVWDSWYLRWETEYYYEFDKIKKVCGDKKPVSYGQYPRTKISCTEL